MKKDILKKLENYFKNTPREKVLQDWEEAKEKSAKNSPTIKEFYNMNNMYTEQEVLEQLNLLYSMKNSLVDTFTDENDYITMKWFEQFKKS